MTNLFLQGKKIQPAELKRIVGGKRISDVAPVLIGGFLIGGAAAIASMMVATSCSTAQDCPTSHLTCNGPQVVAACQSGTCAYSCAE